MCEGMTVSLGVFTKPVHVEKIVNYLNTRKDIDYVISTDKRELYECYDFLVGVSYGFGSLIDVDRSGRPWFNYHPAPLPVYRGGDVYARAVHDRVIWWGVTLHRMTMEVDSGDIIRRRMFLLCSPPVSTNEIGCIAHYHLFQLFKESVGDLVEPVVWGVDCGVDESRGSIDAVFH